MDEGGLPKLLASHTEIKHPELAAVLASKTVFSPAELDALQVPDMSYQSYVKVGDKYMTPVTPLAPGLAWEAVGTARPESGVEIDNDSCVE